MPGIDTSSIGKVFVETQCELCYCGAYAGTGAETRAHKTVQQKHGGKTREKIII